MNIASIDIGSNSVLLLIAEVDADNRKILSAKTYYSTPRISEGTAFSGEISELKIVSLLDFLLKYERIIHSERINRVIITATKAFRAAKNANFICNEIEKRYGWITEIVSGDNEARLTFYGTTYPFDKSNNSKIVIDIGGGSTEVVIGNNKEFSFKNSFSIGVVSLTEKYFHNPIPSEEEIDNATRILSSEFASLKNVFAEHDTAFAVAGTPTTLSCIKLGIQDFNENLVDGFQLNLYDVVEIKKELSQKTPTEILNLYGNIVEGREDVLLSGTMILESAMESLGLKSITVSTRGIRYGAIYNALGWI